MVSGEPASALLGLERCPTTPPTAPPMIAASAIMLMRAINNFLLRYHGNLGLVEYEAKSSFEGNVASWGEPIFAARGVFSKVVGATSMFVDCRSAML